MYKILIVEDEKIVNNVLKTILETHLDVKVYQAFDGEVACDLVINEHLDLIITDIVMPGVDGWEFIEYMNDIELNIPIIITSSLSSRNDQIKGYNLNIEDYLTKPIDEELWILKIKTILERIYPKSDDILVDSSTLTLTIYDLEVPLTLKEFEVFNYLYMHENMVCAKCDILDKFWGEDLDISERVVDHTISRIRSKLGKYGDMIKTKPKVGYYFENEQEE